MYDATNRMQKSIWHLADQLRGIRSGTLSIGFLETFRVATQGRSGPIGHIASLASQNERILITPFDPTNVGAIVRALNHAKVNAYALNPSTVCVGIPPISGEQKAEMIKHIKKLGEETKIAVRAVRQDARKEIAARGRGSERVVQEATDAAVEEIEKLIKAKIAEIER